MSADETSTQSHKQQLTGVGVLTVGWSRLPGPAPQRGYALPLDACLSLGGHLRKSRSF